jgi:hypothetical protein
MKVRRMTLDVDKAAKSPTLFELAQAIDAVPGVEAANITVNEIDMETMGMVITIEGESLNYEKIIEAIEDAGAVVHSVDELIIGSRTLSYVERRR